MRSRVACVLLVVASCTSPDERTIEQSLTAAQRQARAELIRDSAAEMGVYNAALLAGIAISETEFAHCWSEAMWACAGPASPSCDGGPVIAGAADGPCSDMQGGLGMFQFDAGTYDQTLATYGDSILTVEGNTAQAVAFVVERLRQDITGVDDWMTAVDYMNGVPMMSDDPTAVAWGSFLACRYNGCCSSSSTCTTRGANYRDNAIAIYDELGAEFWATSGRCSALPDDGIIDQRTACYLAGGDPRYWRRVADGYGDDHEWTATTEADAPANFARWLIRPGRAAQLQLDVYVSGGTATSAVYEIVHAGTTDHVMIDQTMVGGFVSLGDFAFTGDGTEYVQLADNTGTSAQQLAFDALRVLPLDGPLPDPDPTAPPDDAGCCGGAPSPAGSAAFALVALLALRRRRA
jgi:hypothetical protein